ncbi:MAG: outer membrane beta-barrel protein [Akkermansiaceae bacterium]|nr:outer membrane beta-barrel protein [Akkermansiaceae bacterium]MDP4779537.1 outer membrane beta-barrel protein [Akkermansiaceae bacterium]MDP4997146.1 outer membrane beta-barrel protein [Akkermansiaceae bacterium]
MAAGEMVWDPSFIATENLFIWPPALERPLVYPLPGRLTNAEFFRQIRLVSPATEENEEMPWIPTDLGPIAPPDGIPLLGSPAGLAMMEQAVGTGIIVGEVSDATTLDPIVGAMVEIVGTGRISETDAQGRFQFQDMPSGTFDIEATQLGYFTDRTVITVIEGSPSEVRFGLRVKPTDGSVTEFTLEEETVVGEYNGDSAGDLFLDLQLTSSIASGISKDDFSRSGIGDAGDAVSKISGANIVGGKYAVVRGLGDRYSNTLVNGALISSADPTRKAVQLDLFPSDLLESISIYKTFNPELPAEFAGGTVSIKTLQFPEERVLKVEYGRKYNTNLDGDFYTSGDDLGYFGQVDTALPDTVPPLGQFESGPTRRVPSPTDPQGQEAIANATALHLSSLLRPTRGSEKIPESFAITFGDTFNLTEELEMGVVFAGTSSNGSSVKRDVVVGRSLNSGPDNVSGSSDDFLNRTQVEDRYTSSAGYGVLGSLGFRMGDRHSISFTGFQNYSAEDEVTLARRINDNTSGSGQFADFAGPGSLPSGALQSTPFGATAATFQALDNITPLRRTLTLKQAEGHHEFGDEDAPFEIDWLYSLSDAVEERPGTRTTFFSQLDFTDPRIQDITGAVFDPSLGEILTLSDVFGINPALNQTFRETLKTTESSTNRRLDLTLPIFSDDDENSFKIKIGGNDFEKNREVRGRFFTYNIGQPLNDRLATENGGQFGIDFLEGLNGLVDPNGDPIFNGFANNNRSDGIFIQENTTSGNTVRNVDASTELSALYMQGNIVFGRWEVIAGARYESEDRTFEVLQGLNPAGTVVPRTTITNDYVLPGITITRSFGDDEEFLLTSAWSRTVARPTFFEFAPIRTVDQASGDVFQGNPNLEDTLIDNFDVRWEWKPDAESQLAISAFHKSLDSPIAQAFNLGDKTFINGEKGSLQGIELEVQKRFLEYWTVTSNFTFIDSQLEFQQPPSGLVSTTFDGQPNYIFNCALGWADDESGLSATLNYNLTGSYLTAVPLGANEPPVRREAYNQLDLIIQKKIEFDHGVGIVTLSFGNLLDSTDTEVFDGTELTFRSFKPGRSFGLKFDYEF